MIKYAPVVHGDNKFKSLHFIASYNFQKGLMHKKYIEHIHV